MTGRPPKNRSSIVDLLSERILLSSQLISELATLGGISRAAASRAVERAEEAKQIFSSKPVSFGAGRDHLLWLAENTRSLQYFHEVGIRLRARPAFDCVVQALSAAAGALPARYLTRFIPAPVEVRFGRPTTAKILWDLERIKVIEADPDSTGEQIVSLTKDFKEAFPCEKSRTSLGLLLRTEGLLLKIIAQWLQATALAAWNSVEVRNSRDGTPVTFNGFAFDLKAPTYVQPIARRAQKPIAGFLVADISLSEFREFEARAFIRKLSFIRERRNPPAVIGICFAESFYNEAFKLLRHNGVMVVQLSRLGSQNLPEQIRCIARVFENIQAHGNCDLDKSLRAVAQLVGERETNLSGSIFELMIGRFLDQRGYIVRFIGKKVRGELSGKLVEREVDVVAEQGTILHIVEAKGYHRFQPVELHEVRRFFEETAQIASSALKMENAHSTVAHCFYTTSYFKSDARDYLEKLKAKLAKSSKLRIDFMDGSELREQWENEGLFYLVQYLGRYFGTQRKQVFDPATQTVIEAPAPEFDQFASSVPEPVEVESTERFDEPENGEPNQETILPVSLARPKRYEPEVDT